MKTVLRFFLEGKETCIAQLDIADSAALVPQRYSEVFLDELIEDEFIDYDYYIAKNISYSYGENLTLIDVTVCGTYWYEED